MARADVAAGLFNYQRVMDAYYDTSASPQPVDVFLCDANAQASNPTSSELLSPSSSKPQDVVPRCRLLLRACEGKSGARVALCHVSTLTLTS